VDGFHPFALERSIKDDCIHVAMVKAGVSEVVERFRPKRGFSTRRADLL